MMDNLLPGLVAFPLLAGLVLLFVGNDALRRVFVYVATGAIMVGSVLLAVHPGPATTILDGSAHGIGQVMFVVEALIAVYLAGVTLKRRNWLATGLLLAQFLLVANHK